MAAVGDRLLHALSRANVALYRRTGGRIGARLGKARVLLLTTTGRRSGERRTTPLLYLEDGDDLAVVASYGGRPRHPSWFLNTQSNPNVEVEVGTRSERRRARIASEQERERLWPRLVEMYRPYASYQEKTTRRIPVVILEPIR